MMKQMEEMKQNQSETEEVQTETYSLGNIKKEEQDIY